MPLFLFCDDRVFQSPAVGATGFPGTPCSAYSLPIFALLWSATSWSAEPWHHHEHQSNYQITDGH
jgi:hypothetical protein